MSLSYKEESRRGWPSGEQRPNNEQLKLGCLQRIADATEVMAKNFLTLQSEAKWEKEARQRAEARERDLAHVIRGLRGALTKARRKARGVA